jgi:hypothetical protein
MLFAGIPHIDSALPGLGRRGFRYGLAPVTIRAPSLFLLRFWSRPRGDNRDALFYPCPMLSFFSARGLAWLSHSFRPHHIFPAHVGLQLVRRSFVRGVSLGRIMAGAGEEGKGRLTAAGIGACNWLRTPASGTKRARASCRFDGSSFEMSRAPIATSTSTRPIPCSQASRWSVGSRPAGRSRRPSRKSCPPGL